MGPLQTESGSCDSQMSRCAGQGALEAASEMGVSVLVINGRSSLKTVGVAGWVRWGKLEQRCGSGVARPLPDPAGGARAQITLWSLSKSFWQPGTSLIGQ